MKNMKLISIVIAVTIIIAVNTSCAFSGDSTEGGLAVFSITSNQFSENQIEHFVSGINTLNQNGNIYLDSDSVQIKERTNFIRYDANNWKLKVYHESGGMIFRTKQTSVMNQVMELNQQKLIDIGNACAQMLTDLGLLILAQNEEIRFNEIGFIEDQILNIAGEVVSTERVTAIVDYRRFINNIEVVGGGSLLRVHISSIGEITGFDFLWRPLSKIKKKVKLSDKKAISAFTKNKSDSGGIITGEPKLVYFIQDRHQNQEQLNPAYLIITKLPASRMKESNSEDQFTIIDAISGEILLDSK